jgi:hypothetical protein
MVVAAQLADMGSSAYLSTHTGMIDRQWSYNIQYTSLLYNRILIYALETVVNWGYILAKEKGPACL